MKACRTILVLLCVFLPLDLPLLQAQTSAPAAVKLPDGVKAVWDLDKAFRQKTTTREQICINGLWLWQPAAKDADKVPSDGWGYFKVPGSWPGITDYMMKDTQTLFANPAWKLKSYRDVSAAWYQREISIPADWGDRRIVLRAQYVNSLATVFVDGQKAGVIRFPGGDLEITKFVKPGSKHDLSVLVVSLPLEGVMLSYSDSAAPKEAKGSVQRRGLCGDVYLVGEPAGPQITDVRADTSVRKWEIAFDVGLQSMAPLKDYVLRARILDSGKTVAEFSSEPFAIHTEDARPVTARHSFSVKWKADRLWDTITPQNVYQLEMTLESGGKVLDTALPVPLGFREFWIDGKDFYLNGTRIYLSCVPCVNAQAGAAWATYDAAKESLQRLKSFGINCVYTQNYGCEPGTHLAFEEILRAADDVGMLVSFSQPHFGQYKWKASDAEESNGYARHAEFYVRAAQNHPSVVFYSMSHNGTGYAEDMNPDMIDGKGEPRTDKWAIDNAKLALRAEAIVKKLDPGRIVYHHSSGNLGSMHDMNFYPNWAPIQEMSDWFEHWSKEGVKPAFTCEYGVPFSWDWTMYRGWYKGERSFGSAKVPWEFCFAEWNSQFLGDKAFNICEAEKANLRWEAKQFRDGKLWYRWDYPYEVGSNAFDDRYAVFAMYIGDNWRAFRTWGLSANSPWELGHFWRPRKDLQRNKRTDLKVDWDNLQRPGFSPDYIQDRFERMDLAYEMKDWEATPAAQALIRNNLPVLAYIANGAYHFTGKDHNFVPGENVSKQIILINNSRKTVEWKWQWSANLPAPASGSGKTSVSTGDQARIPIEFKLPADLKPGVYEVKLTADFGAGVTQTDSFTINVLPAPQQPKVSSKIALLDPKGETKHLLEGMGVKFQAVQADADLGGFDLLIVGKGALTPDGPGPNVDRVRDGLKVVVFEQTSDVLEKRFGFRVVEYGLRNVFERVPDHPVFSGLAAENLHDWRGAATLTPAQLKYQMWPMHGPTVKWCGIDVTRVWRCGNYGNVASVLIEKPARGDFLPILDGGFSLQYSPLMEFHQGKGMVLFCQMDVTARSIQDPAAERLARNIIQYAAAWKAPAVTFVGNVFYAGHETGKEYLQTTGISFEEFSGQKLSKEDVLICAGGIRSKLPLDIAGWVSQGGRVLALGLDQSHAQSLVPSITMQQAEHIACTFEPRSMRSPFAGISPADVHNRDPRKMPLVASGAEILGDGVLAASKDGKIVFFQMPPWTFDYRKMYDLKRTFRRSSFTLARLLAEMGVESSTPILERFKSPAKKDDKRWLDGLYLDEPEEMDDPYRFFRW